MTQSPLVTNDWMRCEAWPCHGNAAVRNHCLAHVSPDELSSYLAHRTAGDSLDLRGTSFTSDLLLKVLRSIDRKPGPDTRFDGATFLGDANFSGIHFSGRFPFYAAEFKRSADFTECHFDFNNFGPMFVQHRLDMRGSIFSAAIGMQIAADRVDLANTQWMGASSIELRYASVNLDGVHLERPCDISGAALPFMGRDADEERTRLFGEAPAQETPRILSIRRVDASQLVLTDVDLSLCQFAGAFHLDQISLGGDTRFDSAPRSGTWLKIIPVRYTRRQVLAEEHHWRHDDAREKGHDTSWRSNPTDLPVVNPGPRRVGAIYRQLRKALEDAKNEPDAADFYYGEMEMRRKDSQRPVSERGLLTLYWLISGYGLRAARAFTALVLAAAIFVTLIAAMGIPSDARIQEIHQEGVGERARFVIQETDPKLDIGILDRFSVDRLRKSFKVTIDAAIFRSNSQDLTERGVYVEMGARIVGPLLLALGALALRGRVKRG